MLSWDFVPAVCYFIRGLLTFTHQLYIVDNESERLTNLMHYTVHICTYTCTTYASIAPILNLNLNCDCTSRSSWKHHHISEPSLWTLQLPCDCNDSRWRGGRSILENVHTYSLDHLQCKPHQCWLSGEWHSSHCRIPGSRSSYWVQVQGGQQTL